MSASITITPIHDADLRPLSQQNFDLAGIDIVVNTQSLRRQPPLCRQADLRPASGVDHARTEDGYTIREWVEAPAVRHVPVDGELELLPGLRLVPAPGHTRGMQVVVVEIVGGDVAIWHAGALSGLLGVEPGGWRSAIMIVGEAAPVDARTIRDGWRTTCQHWNTCGCTNWLAKTAFNVVDSTRR